ncbi:MAG: double-strand break repair protein AddB [Alphaproteobacteria bacterium]|nr:double-strand break repair protein AddB [Alphaproteobacteria bacterium]
MMALLDPGLYSIAPHRPFLEDLGAQLLASADPADPLTLSRMTILLPTRRACRGLQETFLRLSDGRALVLPQMIPVGDIDEDELQITEGDYGVAGDVGDIPPAMPDLRRRLLLAQELQHRLGEGDRSLSIDQATELAGELARLLDQVQTERLDFSLLSGLVSGDYARHWQQTLEFLKVLTDVWPRQLSADGVVDPAERRNLLLASRTDAWKANPPRDPVIAAGSTGSIPATADLLAIVADLPAGYVVLPGLDRVLDDHAWENVDATHPQYGLHQLLERLEHTRAQVREWPILSGVATANPSRTRLISEALRPASTTESWRQQRCMVAADSLDDVIRIDAREPHEEAGTIALVLRETLETPGRTAALVTSDRTLARRVTSALGRWGVLIDDSAGVPLAETVPGVFLRGILQTVHDGVSPVSLLAALKHPFAAGGRDPALFRTSARELERLVLRGPRPAEGVAGLRAAAMRRQEMEREDVAARHQKLWPRVFEIIDFLETASAPFAELLSKPAVLLPEIVSGHVAFAELLASTDEEAGAIRLWAGDAGEALAGFVAELTEYGAALGPISPVHYAALFETLLAGRVVRPRYGAHPRLSILGPLEARLQRLDVMVLAGLNEGSWPADANVDPWMGRPMRADFGLPSPERRIGLSAHDFVQGFCAEKVVLTRSERVEGAPTIPARWLTRLEVAIEALGIEGGDTLSTGGERYLRWWRELDGPGASSGVVATDIRPRPTPPLKARPRKLSVTQIETWMRDPYSIYAREILKLQALAPIDQAVDAATYGSLIHKVFDTFLMNFPEGELPADAHDQLIRIGEDVLGEYRSIPAVWTFWWPRFLRIATWFIGVETLRRANLKRTYAEVGGGIELSLPAGPFTLTARADRIDELKGGGIAVIDFKTGAPPSKREVVAGFAPQLPLEAAMVARGGFSGVPPLEVHELAFWRLSGGREPGAIRDAADDPITVAAEAYAGLLALVRKFDDPSTPYEARPRPDKAPQYSDYEHLARVKEWSTAGDSDGGTGS